MRFIQAAGHGGTIRPTLLVIHSMENPLAVGSAAQVAKMFAGNGNASAHFCVDPGEVIQCLPTNIKAWHVGPRANAFTVGFEQAGYARFSRSDWTTPAGMAQLANLASIAAQVADQCGIPKRWASDAEIRAAASGAPAGFCTHADISRVLGGTDHTDPGGGYPRDLLMAAINGQQTGAGMSDISDALYGLRGNDGRNLFDSVIQTRLELRDRAAEGAAAALVGVRGNDGRNVLDSVIQTRMDVDDLKTAVSNLSAPALTDAQVQALADRLAPAVVSAVAPELFKLFQQQLTK